MTLTKDDILEIMAKARDLYVHRIKCGDFEAEFNFANPTIRIEPHQAPTTNHSVSVFPATIKDEKFEDIIQPVSPFDELSEEEILYWGTAYGDELIAKRKAREEELKTETRATGRNRSKPQGDSDVQENSA